jgi:uncharacterized protein (TIGR02996 family)
MTGAWVVMARVKGATGWRVHAANDTAVDLGGLGVEVYGAQVSAVGDAPTVVVPDRRVRFEREEVEADAWAIPFRVLAPAGTLEVVLFRAGSDRREVHRAPQVLKALEAVRGHDTDENRLVLADVLEEAGAVAEAEYVRRELQLQQVRDVEAPSFSEGVGQLRALSSVVGPTFRYLVGRDIAGCAGVRWSFRCPRRWDDMAETGRAAERVCTTCRQVVVQVSDEASAEQLARDGVCASIRIDEEGWEGEVAEPNDDVRGWVGSVAAMRPMPPRAPPPARAPVSPPSVPWWKRLFGR